MKQIIMALCLCAGVARGQTATNKFPVINLLCTNVSVTMSWNFIAAASNLTAQEKETYTERANAIHDMPFMGLFGVDMVASQVRALDAEREVEKILHRVQASVIVITNTVTAACTRAHCDGVTTNAIEQMFPPGTFDSPMPTNFDAGHCWGPTDAYPIPVPHDWTMGTNGYMQPPGSRHVHTNFFLPSFS